ncbi:hypothetical protein R1sor_014560 [Riccia sorocarpa]|uniref:Uncharacterized protein n=1 Tax=Riccia sorocarpa TaxID=122646 RepID=A0ABD3HBK4_9MARC
MTSSKTESQVPECIVCLEPYDDKVNIPRVLSCGHSFCEPCLHELRTTWQSSTTGDSGRKSSGVLRCPECNLGTKLPLGGLKLLPKNIALLRLLPTSSLDSPPASKVETRKSRKSYSGEKQVNFSPGSSQKTSAGDRKSKDKYDSVSSPSTASILHNSIFPTNLRQEFGDWDVGAWILPQEVIELKTNSSAGSDSGLSFGEIVQEQGWARSRISVSLLRLEVNRCGNSIATGSEYRRSSEAECSKEREKSYEQVLLEVADGLNPRTKCEISVMFRTSSLCHRVCKIFGLWMNQELELYLVSEYPEGGERLSWDVLIKDRIDLSKPKDGSRKSHAQFRKVDAESLGREKLEVLTSIGIRLCELLLEIHSQGLVLGLLSPKYIVFDQFDNMLLDMNTALADRNSLLQRTSKSQRSIESYRADGQDLTDKEERKLWEYMCPELLALLVRAIPQSEATNAYQYVKHDRFHRPLHTEAWITRGADAWSLGCIILELLSGKLAHSGSDLYEFLDHIRLYNDENGLFFCLQCLSYQNIGCRDCECVPFPGYSNLQRLLGGCFKYDPKERTDIYEIWQGLKEVKRNNRGYYTPFGVPRSKCLDQKNWVFCLPGFGAEALDEYEKEELREEQEVSSTEEIIEPKSGEVSAHADASLTGEEEGGRLSDPFMEFQGSLEGHRDDVTALIISGEYLLSASFDKTVRVWSLEGMQLLKTFEGQHTQVILALAVDVESTRCFSGDQSGRICVWQLEEDITTPFLTSWLEHDDWRFTGVACLAASEDGILYSGSGDRTIKAWSTQSFEYLCTMEGHKALVSALVVEGDLLYSGGWDGVICVWFRSDHSLLAVLTTPDLTMGGVRSICLSKDLLFAGRDDGSIQIWKDEEFLTTLTAHNMVVSSLCVEGPFLYSGSWDYSIKVWRLEEITSNPSPALEEKCGSGVPALSSDGSKLYVALLKDVKIYSILTGNSPSSSFSDAQSEEVRF